MAASRVYIPKTLRNENPFMGYYIKLKFKERVYRMFSRNNITSIIFKVYDYIVYTRNYFK